LIKVKRLDGRQRYEDEKTRNEKDDEIAVFSGINPETSGKDSAQGLLPFLFDARRYECTIRIGTNGGFATHFHGSRIGSSIIKTDRGEEVRFMPVEIGGKRFYRTSEICSKARISRATLFRWIKTGIVKNRLRDRRGWRLFTEEDVQKLQAEVGKIEAEETSPVREAKNVEK